MTSQTSGRLDAARDFHALTGMTVVPIGVGLVAQGALGIPYLLILGIVASVFVQHWYVTRFGTTLMTAREKFLNILAVLVALLVIGASLVLDGLHLDAVIAGQNILPALLLAPVVTGAGLYLQFRLGLPHSGTTWVHLIVAVAMAAVTVAPLLVAPQHFSFGYRVWAVATGLSLIVTGLYDHLRLLRMMPPVTDDPTVEALR